MSKISQSARGMPCTLQLACCNHNCETTVLAYIRLGFNAGVGQKPPDHLTRSSADNGYLG